MDLGKEGLTTSILKASPGEVPYEELQVARDQHEDTDVEKGPTTGVLKTQDSENCPEMSLLLFICLKVNVSNAPLKIC